MVPHDRFRNGTSSKFVCKLRYYWKAAPKRYQRNSRQKGRNSRVSIDIFYENLCDLCYELYFFHRIVHVVPY